MAPAHARAPGPLPCAIVLALAIATCGIGRTPPTVPAGTTPDDRTDDRITGVVGGPLVQSAHGIGAPLHADGTTVWLWTSEPIEPGESIAATGRLRTPRGYLDPGNSDRAALVASRGASWEMSAIRVEHVVDEPGLVGRTWRWAARAQRVLTQRIGSDTPARAALAGIVTGDRTSIAPALDARWRAVGIYHVLSVSGLHLAVVAGLAFALLRRLVGRSAAPLALLLAVAYTLITGAQLATLRALLVIAIAMVGQMLDRPLRLVDALGAAAIVLLAWRPQDLHDPSFQLSFVAALTLALVPSQGRWLVRALRTSVWVSITTAPITALHFHQITPGGVLGNVVLTPVVELAALPLGLAGALTGLTPLVDVAAWLVARVDDGAALVAHVLPVGTVALDSALACAVLVTLALVACSRRDDRWLAAAAWIALCVTWLVAPHPRPPLAALRVTFLDVGQGDAAVIELPDGEVWLVDAGGVANARDVVAASAPGVAITRTLAVYAHRAIDVAVLSHPHPDHYLGFGGLGVPVGELWVADDVRAAGLVAALVARGTRIVRPPLGIARTRAGVVLRVLAPRFVATDGAPAVLAPDPVRSVNDNSLVVSVEYAGRTLLFAGDLEAEGEAALVAAGLGGVDVVKVAHHGSPTSSSPAFVAATHPALAVVSCGVANPFGFPSPEVIARWQRAGATVARTDEDGAVTVTITREGELRVERYRGPNP